MRTRYLLAILLSVILYGVRSEEEGAIVAVKTDDNDDNDNEQEDQTVVHSFIENEDLEVFQPTSEWQTVRPDQAIPPGLHVKIDLQSGQKEAKLMDGDDGSRYRNHEKNKYFKEQNQSKQKFIKIDKKIVSKQHLKDALKDFRDKFHDEKLGNEEETLNKQAKKFRPIEEIRKDLEDAHLFLKKDVEVIKEHLEILNNTSSSLEEKLHALNELEYYLHQTDNAVDFDTIGGLKLVVKLLNSTEERLSATAAYVLGSAAQSNPTVQKAAQKYGALTILLRLLSPHHSMAVRRKALYALSSLIRLCYSAQKEFIKMNGMEILFKLLSEPGTGQLKTKIVTLTTDILTEQFDLVAKKAKQQGVQDVTSILKQVPLLKLMVKQGWCRLVPDLLHTTDNDTREKVLHALNIMAVGCQEEFKKTNIFHNLDNLQTEWQNILKDVDHEEGEYFVHLTQLVSELKNKLY